MVMIRSWASATIAATDIFHSRKYAQMKSTTSTRKTTSPMAERLAISLPQLGPISVLLMSAGAAPVEEAIVSTTLAFSPVVTGFTWTRIDLSPLVVTTGFWAAGMPV